MKVLLAQGHAEPPLNECLRKEGYDVIVCDDAEQVRGALSSHELPDLAILDWSEFESDIEELLEEFERCERDSPLYVILLGTPENRQSLTQALNNGAHDFLLKPLNIELLKKKVGIFGKIVRDKQALIDTSRVLERYHNVVYS